MLACTILVLDDFVAPMDDMYISPGALAVCLFSLGVGMILKFASLTEQVRQTFLFNI